MPVMGMENIRNPIQRQYQLQGGFAQKTKTLSIIRVFLPILTIKIFAGIKVLMLDQVNRNLWEACPGLDFQGRFQHPAPDFSGVQRHPQRINDRGSLITLFHGSIGGSDDSQVVAHADQLLRQSSHCVGQSPRFRKSSQLGSDYQNLEAFSQSQPLLG